MAQFTGVLLLHPSLFNLRISTRACVSNGAPNNNTSNGEAAPAAADNETKVEIVPYGWQILKPISEILENKNKNDHASLRIGSAIIVVEAPKILKSAEPMPMLRINDGLLQAGDVGRILDRRPKDVWAVRFSFGAYLIDGKYFKPFVKE